MARPRTFDEDEVLDQAVEIFRERGFDGVSLPQLTERLGICRQSIYSVFGDKRGLYFRALERWRQQEIDAKLQVLDAPGSPLENLRTLLRSWKDLAAGCPSGGCLTAAAIVESRDDPAAHAIVEAQVARLEEGIRATLARAKKAGELKDAVQPRRLARTLVTVGYGVGVLARLSSSALRIRDTVSTMLELLEAAAEPPPN